MSILNHFLRNQVSAHETIILTIDMEDWFQVENFKQWITFSSWKDQVSRVERNTHLLLDLFDSIRLDVPHAGTCESPRATFFVLSWFSKRIPHLIREIHDRGHEIASHGYGHEMCHTQTIDVLKEDLTRSKKELEDIIGHEVSGYRAPSFSVNDHVLRVIRDAGYRYDSSFNSFSLNSRYGSLTLSNYQREGYVFRCFDDFFEIPISNLSVFGKNIAWGGGGYFRIIPSGIFKMGVRKIIQKETAYVLYLHPWEFDPDQPKLKKASLFFKMRHYANLKDTAAKFHGFLQSHKGKTTTCRKYLEMNSLI